MVEPSTPATARSSRRSVLATLGSAAAICTSGIAGCLSPSPGTPTVTRTTASPTGSQGDPTSPTGTTETTAPPTNEVLELTVHPVAEAPTPFRVYAPTLADSLTRAADGETVRAHTEVQFPKSRPIIPDFSAIELTDAGDRSGTYEVTAEGGTRYHVLAGAEKVGTVPEDATVMACDSLVAGRRELVRQAIAGDPDARFYPETPLGDWARHRFFGGYVEYEGDVYRGHEVQQTDAAFFSREVWVVCSLVPTDSPEEAPRPVSLAATPDAVRARVDQVYSTLRRDSTEASMEVPEVADAVETYAESTASLLSVTRAFDLSVGTVAAD